MAREEHDREDLLRQATAYVDRAEFGVAGFPFPVFMGFRRDGAASVYCGPEQVYHFNEQGELRRAYRDGLLYKADRGGLVSMERQRAQTETSLLARQLSADETRVFLAAMHSALARLAEAFAADGTTLRGQVTSSETARQGQSAHHRVAEWFAKLPRQFAVARSPRAK
jgi:hypothetical protein